MRAALQSAVAHRTTVFFIAIIDVWVLVLSRGLVLILRRRRTDAKYFELQPRLPDLLGDILQLPSETQQQGAVGDYEDAFRGRGLPRRLITANIPTHSVSTRSALWVD